MPSSPEISVVIPTFNRWPIVHETVGGALRQEGVELEVIVVDDCSPDGTAERLEAADDERLRVFRHETNRGVAAARNTGINAARGEWLAFLDDDDLWSPRKLRTQLDLAASERADFVYSAAVVLNERRVPAQILPAPDPGGLLRALMPGNAIPAGASNVIARTDVVRRLGGFDEALFQLADWEMWIRMARDARAAACEEPLFAYIEHPANMLLTDKRNLVLEFDHLERKHRALIEEHGVGPDRAGLARWMAWGHARAGRRFRATRLYLRAALKRPSYGSRQSLEDALRTLLGRHWTQRSGRPPLTEAAVPAWLDLYR
jgi:glycosyltransferase involved in cell wall biosynthesis